MGDFVNFKVQYCYKDKVKNFKFDKSSEAFFKSQIDYFLKNVDNPKLMNNLGEARELLTQILRIKQKK